MYLIAIAWMYVVVMMAVAEATGTGTVLGAIFTLLLYGLLPLGIVLYIFGTPGRRQLRKRQEAEAAVQGATPDPDSGASPRPAAVLIREERAGADTPVEASAPAASSGSLQPDARDHAAGLPVAPERKEPGRL